MPESLLDRFIKYVKIDTQSIEDAPVIPSSPGQLELAKIVAEDLKKAGVKDITVMEKGYLTGTIYENIPSTHPAKGKVPVIGFVAHFDTAPESPSNGVKPRVIKNYSGEKIIYPANSRIEIDPATEPELKKCLGHTIITSDGTTTLGADDKSGIAEIVEMAQHFTDHPNELHGEIKIGMMPDEETGAGSEHFDIKGLGTEVAYTVDGDKLGAIDVGCFNAWKGKVSIKGVAAFPGEGKGEYLSAIQLAGEFISAIPSNYLPQNCDGMQPILFFDALKGGVPESEFVILLRAFTVEEIEEEKKLLEGIKNNLLNKHPKAQIDISFTESYKNYKYELDKDKRIVEYAKEAMKRIGIEPIISFARGGNDSGEFCNHGVLSANIFCGFNLLHTQREWVSLEIMEKATENLISLAKIWFEKTK